MKTRASRGPDVGPSRCAAVFASIGRGRTLSGPLLVALLLAVLGRLLSAQTSTPSGERPSSLPSIQITSPLGRTGMVGTIRIVARVTLAAGTKAGVVRFFVDGQLVGEDRDGAPFAVEWVDRNPLEAREISAEVVDSAGVTARTAYALRPLEVVEKAIVSSVILEPSVRDERGRPVNGLGLDDFIVTEDGVPQKPDLITPDTIPASYTLLVDASQSMSRRMAFVRDAARQLPSRLSGRDSVTVVPFTTTLGTVTGPTRDRDTIVGAIDGIVAKGGTALLDALGAVARQLRSAEGRQILVLLTDGYDENSKATFQQVMAAVRESKTTVYVIAIGGVAGVSLRGEDLLRQLATATGGRAFFPTRDFQLSDIHGLIASDVQQRYVLSYTPLNQRPDASYRTVGVKTKDPAHTIVVRAGYTAPEPPPIRPQIELTVRDLARQHLDVTPEDFAVFEDGVEQIVEGFEEALSPVSIILVLDQSGSMRRDAPAVVEAARTFARQMPGKDRVGVMLFSDRPTLVQDLSAVREFVIRAIGKYQANGGTALYDSLVESLDRLRKVDGRTAIVVLTDGRDEDNPGRGPGSTHTLEDVLGRLKDTRTTVYAIGLGPNVDRATLERLAEASLGEAYVSADTGALADTYRRILENLRRRYVISYTSTNGRHDGSFRKVEVRVKREGIAVETTDGYQAPMMK